MHLSDSERQAIGEQARRFEARTGTQVVAAVVDRCDAYPEIPWRAFALAASMAALAVLVAGVLAVTGKQAGAMSLSPTPFVAIVAVLGSGAAAALATIFVPRFAHLFLDAGRADAEVRQYAASFFLEHGLTRTRQRRATLLLVGVFERRVVLLQDIGLHEHCNGAELGTVVARMTPLLARGHTGEAIAAGLAALEALLVAKGLAPDSDAGDEIVDELIEEKGV